MYLVPKECEKDDMIEFTNRVCLHCCSSYCLTKKGIDVKLNDERTVYCLKCRMEYGIENKLVKAKTNGKPVRKTANLGSRNDMSVLEPERDHPRLVSGSLQLARGYSANYDFQVILALLNDVSEIGDSENVLQWAKEYIDNFNKLTVDEKNDLQIVYSSRRYFNKEDYVRFLIQYVVGYCCKGEKSPKDAVNMLKSIIYNDNINGDTSF